MAWTSPMTAVANAAFTAAQFNTYVRDNLNETAPAKATTAGSIFVATGANAIAERRITMDRVTTNETTSSASFVDLATVGPSVSASTGAQALVMWNALASNNTAGAEAFMGVEVAGATTGSPSTSISGYISSGTANDRATISMAYLYTLTPGTNVFTAKYQVTGGTASFNIRNLIVMAL